jgi:hypothetical protein
MQVKATFIAPMLLLNTEALPDDAARWEYELKLDGYRTIAFKTGGKLHLRSRNNKDFLRSDVRLHSNRLFWTWRPYSWEVSRLLIRTSCPNSFTK